MRLSTGRRGVNGMNSLTIVEAPEARFYHDGKGKNWSAKTRANRGTSMDMLDRDFIAWDGESGSGHGVVQAYHLFACMTPDGGRWRKSADGLSTRALLRFIVEVEEQYPDAIHVGFGFGYDVNQILADLNEYQLETIHKTGVLWLDFRTYRLEWRKGKSFTVTRHYPDGRRTTAVIYDVFSFFMSSFVNALEGFNVTPLETLQRIKDGKQARGTFTYDQIDDFVLPYCLDECAQLVKLMERFRELVYGAGFQIKHWHGPGAIASYLLGYYGVKQAMREPHEELRLASQYAYAAGRFELLKVGHAGRVWSVDINSAYPHAISQLPNLRQGRWVHVDKPKDIARFGVYRIKGGPGYEALFAEKPAPLWHRDTSGRISFPWHVDGWYWSPEAALVKSSPHYEIVEGWVFVPDDNCTRPFEFVERMYAQRAQWKAEGNKAEYALKLGMNSLYGKMAQRVGWDRKRMKAPPWHQLEWAGWVTSYCRARMYKLGSRLGWEHVVAIETDGLYVTRDPGEVGITSSKVLGELSVDEYEDCIYVQSGLAWLKEPGSHTWIQKYRGLDPESLPVGKMIEHLSHIDWDNKVEATTTRFIGIGAALASRDYLTRWRRWEQVPRLIAVGGDGKRVHIRKLCKTCAQGLTPMEQLHGLQINLRRPGMSAPHFLPWVPDVGKDPPWREQATILKDMLLEGR